MAVIKGRVWLVLVGEKSAVLVGVPSIDKDGMLLVGGGGGGDFGKKPDEEPGTLEPLIGVLHGVTEGVGASDEEDLPFLGVLAGLGEYTKSYIQSLLSKETTKRNNNVFLSLYSCYA